MNDDKLNLLVVEDDEDDFILLRHLLLKALPEVAVERAPTPDDALAWVGRSPFDVCFFDYRLGPVTGLDLLREFKDRSIDTPVIFLTGQGDEEVAVQAMKAGASDYMLKSKLSEPALTRAIRYALNLHKKEKLLEEAQGELRAREEHFRALVEHSHDATELADTKGNTIWVSHSAQRILGYTPEELAGTSHFDLIHRDDRARVEQQFEEVKRTPGQAYMAEFRGRHKDGSWRWLEAVAISHLNDPAVGAVVINYRDITERKHAEEALRRSRDEWEITFNSMSEGVSFHDVSYRILRTNEAFRRLTAGRQGTTCTQLVHGLDVPPPYCPMARVLATKQTQTSEFFEPCLGRTLDVRADPVLNNGGEVTSIVHVIQDVTESRALQSQLQQAQKMEAIGQLAGGIAHDFNNLLMVITSYAELMLEAARDDPKLRRDAGEILKAGQRAAALTLQLLAFSRKQVLAPRLLDLNAALGDISRILPRLIGEDVAVQFVPGRGLWPVKADPVQIEQVVMNLAANARDAMPQGGRLMIETSNVRLDDNYARQHVATPPGEYVLMALTDTGAGIDPAIQPHIFEPFFTTKNKGKGTGLGLPSVYGIVKQSGGFIWLYSELGHGTTFKIYLPRAQEAGEPLPALDKKVEGPICGSETILLVEDEDAVRQAAHEFLEVCGYTVLQARGGAEALTVAERFQGRMDLLVTDVVMPGMSGRELADRLLVSRPEMKVLYVSGYTERAVLQRGVVDLGCMFLQKPFSLNALAHKVREVLGAKRAAAQAAS